MIIAPEAPMISARELRLRKRLIQAIQRRYGLTSWEDAPDAALREVADCMGKRACPGPKPRYTRQRHRPVRNGGQRP